MDNELKYILALDAFVKFGPASLKKILAYFPDPKTAFNSSLKELVSSGISGNIAEEFILARKNIDPDSILEEMDKEGIKALLQYDEEYPMLLKEIYNPPFILYYKGTLSSKETLGLAVVGTRKFSSYGQQATEKLSFELAKTGLEIVSGLALGIDTIAHNAALDAGGRTIGVLGTGVDNKSIYPPSNRYLAEKIVDNGGMIISEFPVKTQPLRHHFPRRNRIIAGLSLGTLVVEAGERSGALITAEFALEQNREIFAVPGNIFSLASKGPNKLIRNGARPVTDISDILEVLDLSKTNSHIEARRTSPESIEEKEVYSHLNHDGVHVDELVRLTNLNTSVINSTLTMMEVKGMVKNIGGMRYVIAC